MEIRELEGMESKILAAEEKLETLRTALESERDPKKLSALGATCQELEQEIEKFYSRWATLADLAKDT
jgi:predicted  nucleic acid-binding Zn-ribbon protein